MSIMKTPAIPINGITPRYLNLLMISRWSPYCVVVCPLGRECSANRRECPCTEEDFDIPQFTGLKSIECMHRSFVKAARGETLRTVTTDYSIAVMFDILSRCITDGHWKTINFDISQPIFNRKFLNELPKRLNWALMS